MDAIQAATSSQGHTDEREVGIPMGSVSGAMLPDAAAAGHRKTAAGRNKKRADPQKRIGSEKNPGNVLLSRPQVRQYHRRCES